MKHQDSVTAALRDVFSSTLSLYWQTHTAHWNVESPDFPALHALFEEQYEDLWKALDGIAERVRVLGAAAPDQAGALSGIALGTQRASIIETLVAGHESMVSQIKAAIHVLDEADDIAGADYLTERLASHEKMAWMLRASR